MMMRVHLDERWPWVRDTISAVELGIDIHREHPKAWWIVVGAEMFGPFDDRAILRAVRIACTPMIDGCSRGPTTFGLYDLEPRRPLRRAPSWQPVRQDELPPSVTTYGPAAVAPPNDDVLPRVDWSAGEDWTPYLAEAPGCAGRLATRWNVHPAGSLVFSDTPELAGGLVVVDLPAVTPD
jgi:hypothetical protein